GAVKKEDKPRKFQAIRGTRDLLPPETALWNRVEQTANSVFPTFGFGEIRLPIFEETELFARSVGEDTDIVTKEMFALVTRSDKLEDPKVLGEYGAFIEKAKKLFESGEIPQTSANEIAIEDMESAWKKHKGGHL